MTIQMVENVTNIEHVSSEIEDVFHNYIDIMSDSLPKMLLSHRGINHEIELLLGVKPPTKNAYQKAPSELPGLIKKIDKLLVVGFILLARASYQMTRVVLEEERWDLTFVHRQ